MSRIIKLVQQQLNELKSYQEDVKTSWSKVKKPKRSVHVKKLTELCKVISFQIELIQETIPDLEIALQCRDDTIMELGKKLSDIRLTKTKPFFCVDHNKRGPNLARSGEENNWNIARKTVLEKEMAEEMARLSLMPMGSNISKEMLEQVSKDMLQSRKTLHVVEEVKETKRLPGLTTKEERSLDVCYSSGSSIYDMAYESDTDYYSSSDDAADSVTSGFSFAGRTSVESNVSNDSNTPPKSLNNNYNNVKLESKKKQEIKTTQHKVLL